MKEVYNAIAIRWSLRALILHFEALATTRNQYYLALAVHLACILTPSFWFGGTFYHAVLGQLGMS